MFKTKDILRIGYFGSSEIQGAQKKENSFTGVNGYSQGFFGYLRSLFAMDINPLWLPTGIKVAVKSHHSCIQLASAWLKGGSELLVRCRKHCFMKFSGILNGLNFKFAVFLGRLPP